MPEPTPMRRAADPRPDLVKLIDRLIPEDKVWRHKYDFDLALLELGMEIALTHPDFADRMVQLLEKTRRLAPLYTIEQMHVAVGIAHGEIEGE